ncbi:MAG: hypothetical protein MUO76_06090 [Anaerolineaceae bacterium]|nr:hypothetical protein [Anaerolineaceae bacterium]
MINWKFLRNIIIKACVLFLLANLIFIVLAPVEELGRISAYNVLFPGRNRFPFGEDHQNAHNLSLYNVNAMFASHEIHAVEKPDHEYRIIVVGDSSVWGTLLRPEETLAGQLEMIGGEVCDGGDVRVYNLGYPTMSLFKDLMIIDEAVKYQPDLVIWLVTLESFPTQGQLSSPIIANNPDIVRRLIHEYDLSFDAEDPALVILDSLDRTIIGQRRALADLARLQLYGFLWAATGVDQVYPQDYQPAQRDFDADYSFHDLLPPSLPDNALAFELLTAGAQAIGDIPFLIVNEPILVSTGENSDIRYNFYYPRWAYDSYRSQLQEEAVDAGWNYLDVWDLVPENEFTNSAVHLTPKGVEQLTSRVIKTIENLICGAR